MKRRKSLLAWWDAGIEDYTIQVGNDAVYFTDPHARPAVPTTNERWFLHGGKPETGCLYEDYPIEPFMRLGEQQRGEPSLGRSLRFEILTRDGFRCQYCGRTAIEAKLEVDHVHPRSRGGTNHRHNLVTACQDCNQGKKARYAPHPTKKAKPQSRLSEDQQYVCELLRDAEWRAIKRWDREITRGAIMDAVYEEII